MGDQGCVPKGERRTGALGQALEFYRFTPTWPIGPAPINDEPTRREGLWPDSGCGEYVGTQFESSSWLLLGMLDASGKASTHRCRELAGFRRPSSIFQILFKGRRAETKSSWKKATPTWGGQQVLKFQAARCPATEHAGVMPMPRSGHEPYPGSKVNGMDSKL